MHGIVFYSDRRGASPVLDYMRQLRQSDNKDSRVKLNKIAQYLKVLEEKGTTAGEPYMKRLSGEIWELRPLRDRILFAAIVGGRFILLHSFIKQTQKTPTREIEQAKRELADYNGREENA